MNIGDREVLQTQIGEHVIYKQPDWVTTWFEFPRGIQEVIMRYSPEDGLGYFCVIQSTSVANMPAKDYKYLELPEGFEFDSGNPDVLEFYSGSVAGTHKTTYDGNLLYINYGNPGQTPVNSMIKTTEKFHNLSVFTFKIKKI